MKIAGEMLVYVRKRNRAMFEKNIFHFSDFFLDKIDFNLDKI